MLRTVLIDRAASPTKRQDAYIGMAKLLMATDLGAF